MARKKLMDFSTSTTRFVLGLYNVIQISRLLKPEFIRMKHPNSEKIEPNHQNNRVKERDMKLSYSTGEYLCNVLNLSVPGE